MTLRVENLSLSFRCHGGPPLSVLDGISFAVSRHEVVGLAGGSGAGKSLIADALIGALPRNAESSGHITADGAAIRQGALALAPQRLDALDPLTPVGRQIARFARLAGRRVETAGLLARLELPATAVAAYPHELSGGMARRALLATALATGADWLVADEPTVGLHPDAADRIMSLLSDLAAEGRGVIVISHDVPRLVRIAQRIVILREGRHVETAPATAFSSGGGALRSSFTRELWGAQIDEPAPC